LTRVAIVGARDHRALAQVWRRVRELPADTTLVLPPDGDVAAVASIAARQRGLMVETRSLGDMAGVDCVEAFRWTEPDVAMAQALAAADSASAGWNEHDPDRGSQGLLVFSSQRAYRGPGAFCVMRFGGGPEAEPFAPSAEILQPALDAREQANELRKAARQIASAQLQLGEAVEERAERERRAAELDAQAEAIEEAAFAAYRPQFLAEMRVSCGLTKNTSAWTRRPAAERELNEAAWTRGVRTHPEAWRRLLALGTIVLTCACTREDRCHRGILRAEILPALGAVDGGEIPCGRPSTSSS
jgi:hypothetical protein